MLIHSVRWRSETIWVEIGNYSIPRVYVYGEYLIKNSKYGAYK